MDPLSDTPAEPRGATIGVFLIAFLACAYFFNGGGQNQNVNFDLARSLVEQGSIRIDDYRDNSIDVSYAGGHFYSNKAPGVSFLAAIPYAVIHAIMQRPPAPGLELTLVQYLCTVVACGLPGGAIAALVFVYGRRGGAPRGFLAACAIATVVGTPLLPYATMLFPHVPNALLMIAAMFALFGGERQRPAVAGALLGLASFTNYLTVPLLVPFGAAMLVRSTRRLRDALAFSLAAAPGLLALAAYQRLAFGSFFSHSMANTKTEFISRGAFLGLIEAPRLDVLWHVTLGSYRGLFFLSPFLLASFAGAAVMLRNRATRLEAGLSVATIAYYFWFAISFNGWHGGYTIGPRYILPIVPLVAMFVLQAPERLRPIVLFLVPISIAMNVAVTAVDPQPPLTLRDPVFEYIVPTLVTGVPPEDSRVPWLHDWFPGHVGVNRLTVSERQIFRHFLPGSAETEWASFNLGEAVFSVGSLLSLLPLVLLSGICGLWTWRRCRE